MGKPQTLAPLIRAGAQAGAGVLPHSEGAQTVRRDALLRMSFDGTGEPESGTGIQANWSELDAGCRHRFAVKADRPQREPPCPS